MTRPRGRKDELVILCWKEEEKYDYKTYPPSEGVIVNLAIELSLAS